MVCRCDTPAPFVPGRRRATSRPPGKAVPAPVRRHARARLCGYALGRMRVHTCAIGQARGTPPPRGVHSGGAACTYRRGGVTSRRDGDRLFLRPRAAFSPIAAGDMPPEGRNARKSQKNGQCGQTAAHAARRTTLAGAECASPLPPHARCVQACVSAPAKRAQKNAQLFGT